MKKIKVQFKKFTKLGRGRGSGMIEILIATGVVGIVMTAVVSGFVLSVKSTTVGKNKVLASTRAQEAMEVFRREKVLLGWAQFRDSMKEDSVNGSAYCLDALPSDSETFRAMQAGACGEDVLVTDTIFSRQASVYFFPDADNIDKIRVEIVVDWAENNIPINLIQEFKQYD